MLNENIQDDKKKEVNDEEFVDRWFDRVVSFAASQILI